MSETMENIIKRNKKYFMEYPHWTTKMKEENKKLKRQLKILQKYQVKKNIDGEYFLAMGIYSIATFGKDFKKEVRELEKALEE